MGGTETLLVLYLTSSVLPAWAVMLYVLLVSLLVLMRHNALCLVATYLFVFYWGFLLYSATFVSNDVYLLAFIGYTISGLAIPGLIAMAGYFSRGGEKRGPPASAVSEARSEGQTQY